MKRFNLISLLIVILIAMTPKIAFADIGGLTKCSESAAFNKRLKTSVKKLEQRVSQLETWAKEQGMKDNEKLDKEVN